MDQETNESAEPEEGQRCLENGYREVTDLALKCYGAFFEKALELAKSDPTIEEGDTSLRPELLQVLQEFVEANAGELAAALYLIGYGVTRG